MRLILNKIFSFNQLQSKSN